MGCSGVPALFLSTWVPFCLREPLFVCCVGGFAAMSASPRHFVETIPLRQKNHRIAPLCGCNVSHRQGGSDPCVLVQTVVGSPNQTTPIQNRLLAFSREVDDERGRPIFVRARLNSIRRTKPVRYPTAFDPAWLGLGSPRHGFLAFLSLSWDALAFRPRRGLLSWPSRAHLAPKSVAGRSSCLK